MELRHLQTFVAVAKTLNISAAARQLRVTQPALSRHIQSLEHVIGHALFVRHQNGLRLTTTGATLFDGGVKALAAVADAVGQARGAAEIGRRVVRFGYYGMSVWESVLAPAVEMFDRKFPDVTLHMVEESSVHLASGLRQGGLDVALLGSGDYDVIPGSITEVACRVPAVAVVASDHRLAKKRMLSLEDLRHEEIVGFKPEDAPGRYGTFLVACREAGFDPAVSYVASIFPELCLAVKKRMGVGIISSFATNVPHRGVVFIKLKPPGVPMEVYTAVANGANDAAHELARIVQLKARQAALLLDGQ